MEDLFRLLVWAVISVSIILGGLTIYRWRDFTGYLRYYTLWIINGAVMEILSKYLADNGISNLFLFHINALSEFVLLVLFFDILYKNSGFKGIRFVLIPGVMLIVFNSLYVQTVDSFNSYTLTAISFGVVLLSIDYYIRLIDVEISADRKMFKMIVVGSIFILHISNLVPILFSNYLLNIVGSTQIIVWLLRACVVLIVKILVFYTLLSYIFQKDIKD